MNIKIPKNLIHSIQSSYVATMFKDGVFTFQNIDKKTIETVIESFILWSEENNYLNDSSLDISSILRKD